MDAVTLVAAAVAVACDQSRNAALEDLLRDRELQAMRPADLESRIAQRMFTRNTQLGNADNVLVTWQCSREELANDYADMVDTLQQVRGANREGDGDRIEELIREQLGDSSAASQSEQLSEGSQSDVGSSDQEPPPAPSQRCARCGDTSNLELMLPTGPWVDAPMEARLFCRECLYGS